MSVTIYEVSQHNTSPRLKSS